MQNGMGGGVPRVQMPGGGGPPGGAPGGMPPQGGGGMGGGMGGGPPAPGASGQPVPPELMGKVDPSNEMQMEMLRRADMLSEQEGAALLEAIMSDPAASQAMMKLLPELGFIIEAAQGGGGMPQGQPGMPPQNGGAPPAPSPRPPGSAPGGMPPGGSRLAGL